MEQCTFVDEKVSRQVYFCTDFHDLEARTKKNVYLIPNIDCIFDRLRRSRYILKIELKLAYLQILLEESSEQYTTFAVYSSEIWQFKRMAFGLINAPCTFQKIIDGTYRLFDY